MIYYKQDNKNTTEVKTIGPNSTKIQNISPVAAAQHFLAHKGAGTVQGNHFHFERGSARQLILTDPASQKQGA